MVQINGTAETGVQEAIADFELAHLGELDSMSVQYFRFKPGATVPKHAHPQEQIGFVFEGELTLVVDGEPHTVGPGDAYLLESDEPHAGENRTGEDVVGIDVFSPPRDAPNWTE